MQDLCVHKRHAFEIGRTRNNYVLAMRMSAQWLYIRGTHAVTGTVPPHEARIRKRKASAEGIPLQT